MILACVLSDRWRYHCCYCLSRNPLHADKKVPGPKLKTEILQWSCSAYWVLSQLALCSPNFSTRVKPSLV